ncbi:hypothetical protein M569_14587 [Genlisea aurea]|uniref:Uncharacterized protein n=1 Tax=Genlisea aurea TaxID=192259 RepID=S8C728_9LAMI|nr:hypothetical protein M569_14587 [Genlisea aurea]
MPASSQPESLLTAFALVSSSRLSGPVERSTRRKGSVILRKTIHHRMTGYLFLVGHPTLQTSLALRKLRTEAPAAKFRIRNRT